MSDTPETDRQWAEWLNKLKMPIESFVDFTRRLERERDEALKLLAEMKQAIIWAKAEAKERLHRLDQAACERRTWLEATHKMKLERDEAQEALKRITECDMRWSKKIARDALEGAK
jgi:hypothetical protein